MRDMLLVLDYDHLAARTVARKLRSERVCCKIAPGDAPMDEIAAQEPIGLVLAAAKTRIQPPEALLSLDIPLLALSSASAWLCDAAGGHAGPASPENGLCAISYEESPLLEGLEPGDRMLSAQLEMELPSGYKTLAVAGEKIPFVFSDAEGKRFGAQMDIEPHDPEGTRLLSNFALNVCGCTPWWDEDAFVLRSVQEIRRVVGDGAAMCAMTGGLNSGVSALLAYKALGARLKCIFIDTGLLREGESSAVMAYYRDQIGLDITRINAQDTFLSALQGLTDGAQKKAVIGKILNEILTAERNKIQNLNAVIRGTSYTDVIASTAPKEGDWDEFKAIEPVRDLFKDEIRQVGEYLGMPAEIISTQPFPGSGLALRILGEATEKNLTTLRAADKIFRDEVAAAGQGKRLWQHFAVLSGMQGSDERVICLRAVHATDGTLAHAARLPYELLETVTTRILKECPDVHRVVYDMTPSTHYAGIEWQ